MERALARHVLRTFVTQCRQIESVEEVLSPAEQHRAHGKVQLIDQARMNPNQVSTATGAYEVQIWDKNPNPAYATGSLVNVASVNPIHKAGGRWNTYEIYAKGPEITVRLNGNVTVSAYDKKFPEGRIGIQFNGGPIKVRKLMVKEQ